MRSAINVAPGCWKDPIGGYALLRRGCCRPPRLERVGDRGARRCPPAQEVSAYLSSSHHIPHPPDTRLLSCEGHVLSRIRVGKLRQECHSDVRLPSVHWAAKKNARHSHTASSQQASLNPRIADLRNAARIVTLVARFSASNSPFAAASDQATGEPSNVGGVLGLEHLRVNYRSGTHIAIHDHLDASDNLRTAMLCCAMSLAMCQTTLGTTLQHRVPAGGWHKTRNIYKSTNHRLKVRSPMVSILLGMHPLQQAPRRWCLKSGNYRWKPTFM